MDSKTCKQNLRSSHIKIMKEIGNVADQLGEQCFAVGGLVRDCLTNRTSDDLDIVCTDIDELTNVLAKREHIKKITDQHGITKETFRTNILMFENEKIDLVEPRKEIYSQDSIKPLVQKGTLEEDALRRDFTINTLRLGMGKNDFLKIYDPTGKGFADLRDKRLRTPRDPKKTFEEDSSRMIRAIRFSSCHNLSIDPEVMDTIQEMASEIHRVPPELLHKEIKKGAKCKNYYRTMYRSKLLHELFPEVTDLEGIPQRKTYHTEDALEHTLRFIEFIPRDSIFKTAGLLHDIGKSSVTDKEGHAYGHEKISAKMVKPIGKRLRFSGAEIDRMEELVKNHMRLHQVNDKFSEKGLRKFVKDYHHILPELKIMARADILSDHPQPTKALQELDAQYIRILETQEKMRELIENEFKLEIDGHDIKKRGWVGREIGEIKEHITDQVVKNELPNKRDVLLQHLDILKRKK